MPFDAFSNADNVSITGPVTISKDPNGGVDGNLTVNGLSGITAIGLNLAEGTGTPQALATGSAAILIPSGQSVVRVSAAAAATGASLPLGSRNGQILILVVTSAVANTITFAAAGTSNVAGGAAVSIAGLASHLFVWDATGALWYQVGPATN